MTSIGRGWVLAEMEPLKNSQRLRPARHSDGRGCAMSSDSTDLSDYHQSYCSCSLVWQSKKRGSIDRFVGLDFKWLLKIPEFAHRSAWERSIKGKERGYTEKLFFFTVRSAHGSAGINEASRRWWTRR